MMIPLVSSTVVRGSKITSIEVALVRTALTICGATAGTVQRNVCSQKVIITSLNYSITSNPVLPTIFWHLHSYTAV